MSADDLQSRGQWPENPARLASLVGQTALLVGVLHLMGPRHLEASRAHYDLALQAAREGGDSDLASYVLGSLASRLTAIRALAPSDAYVIQ